MRAICLWLLLALPAAAQPAQVWFAPIDPRDGLGTPDFMDLFSPGAPWPRAAAQVKVFKLYPQFVVSAPEEQLRRAVEGLRARNIQLAIEFGMLTPTATCGQVEGYGGIPVATVAIERLKRAGADLRYIAMDEPVWFGHRDLSPAACRSPIKDIARDAAATAAVFRTAFPAVQVGDIEPMPTATGATIPDMAEFADAWLAETGAKLAFMALDLPAMVPWVATIEPAAAMLRSRGVPLTIIYNGDGADRTDAAWLGRTERRYEAWESEGRTAPEIALFQSWNANPTRVLPETAPLAFTHALLRYARPRPTLEARRDGAVLSGRLLDAAGAPIAGAPLTLTRRDQTGPGHTAPRTQTGTTPARATQAIFLLRINHPECGCDGPADIAIGGLKYLENGKTPPGAKALPGWQGSNRARMQPEGPALHILATRGQAVMLNAAAIAVTANAPYAATVAMRASPASLNSGYAGLAFLDNKGRELERLNFPLEDPATPIGALRTATDGAFRITIPPKPGATVQINFAGNEGIRGATATLP